VINRHLEIAGLTLRVTQLSLAAQGIARTPEKHLGFRAARLTAAEKKLINDDRKIQRRLQRALNQVSKIDVSKLLQQLRFDQEQSAFTIQLAANECLCKSDTVSLSSSIPNTKLPRRPIPVQDVKVSTVHAPMDFSEDSNGVTAESVEKEIAVRSVIEGLQRLPQLSCVQQLLGEEKLGQVVAPSRVGLEREHMSRQAAIPSPDAYSDDEGENKENDSSCAPS
jgi:hypothetical protein